MPKTSKVGNGEERAASHFAFLLTDATILPMKIAPRLIPATALIFILGGCASSNFSLVGENEYKLAKNSDACAVGAPGSVLEDLRQEAIRFCAGRKETPVEVKATTEYGIPVFRCASAELVFRCASTAPR